MTVRIGTPVHIRTNLRAMVCAMSVHIVPVHEFPVLFPVLLPVHVHVLPVEFGSRNFVVVGRGSRTVGRGVMEETVVLWIWVMMQTMHLDWAVS